MSTSSTNVSESPKREVVPSGCGPGAAGGSSTVYVMGALGYDFGTYARRDAFQAVNSSIPLLANTDLSNYLVVTPVDADSVIWTLNINNTAVYALHAVGPYAMATYQQLQAYLLDPNIDLISVPGRLAGNVTLLNGQVVPVIHPDLLGLKTWSPFEIVPATGEFTVTHAPITAGTQVYLTGEGSLDWDHWGLNTNQDRNQKLSVSLPGINIGSQIVPSSFAASRGTGYSASFLWNDGTPTPNFTPNPAFTSGYLQLPSSNAFTLTVNVTDNMPRVLRVYVRNDLAPSTTGGPCTLTASFTGFTTTNDQSFVSTTATPSVDGVYTIAFQLPAGTLTGTLTVTWQASAQALAGLQAATLQVGAVTRPSPLQNYLDRIHFELRNMGSSSQERALNFAATYATALLLPRFNNSTLFGAMFAQGMVLEGFDVQRNTRCRPGGDCWDVLFKFFNPSSNTEWSRPSFRLTVDVSQVKPLVLGQLQRWNEF